MSGVASRSPGHSSADPIPDYWLVVPAAGSGARFGGAVPKQHLALAGTTVLEVALQPFLADAHCLGVVLALAPADPQRAALAVRLPAHVRWVDGGTERADSVLAALAALPAGASEQDWVLVHDAARPCLSPRDLRQLLRSGAQSAAGALLAAPLADTLKQDDGSTHVQATLPRERLWRALTPQMFRRGPLTAALQAARAAGRLPTDEAQAVEWQGGRPLLVPAHDGNPKITTAEDLPLAAALLAARGATNGET